MNITKFSKNSDFTLIRRVIEKHLKNAADELGLESMKTGSISYSDLEMTVRLECRVKSDSIAAQSKNLESSRSYGFQENIVGRKFKTEYRREMIMVEIIGFNPSKPKYPIATKILSGSSMGSILNFNPSFVRQELTKSLYHS